MADAGVKLHAHCDVCGAFFHIDPVALASKLGSEFSLWNRPGRCKSPGCPGKCTFHYSAGAPFLVMLDRNVYKLGGELIGAE